MFKRYLNKKMRIYLGVKYYLITSNILKIDNINYYQVQIVILYDII